MREHASATAGSFQGETQLYEELQDSSWNPLHSLCPWGHCYSSIYCVALITESACHLEIPNGPFGPDVYLLPAPVTVDPPHP